MINMVTSDDMMEQVHADDSEKDMISLITQNAISAVKIAINQPYDNLSDDEKNVFNSAVLILGGKMYTNRDDTVTEQDRSMLDNIIALIRIPEIGFLGGLDPQQPATEIDIEDSEQDDDN